MAWSAMTSQPNDGNPEEESEWKQQNGIYTFTRVNPISYDSNHVQTNMASKSTYTIGHSNGTHLSHESKRQFFSDSVLDDIHASNAVFASQDDVWQKFQTALLSIRGRKFLSVIALGGSFSGKSHSLFGDFNSEKKGVMGIVPRFICDCFRDKVDCPPDAYLLLQIRMFMIVDEQVQSI